MHLKVDHQIQLTINVEQIAIVNATFILYSILFINYNLVMMT